ncbi:hypothetical protein ABW20_dc0100378 [Dactylellina cionopaga]|nr:hypothetical protein ABW20_dc0100378 [Dactylellina cionopaga]
MDHKECSDKSLEEQLEVTKEPQIQSERDDETLDETLDEKLDEKLKEKLEEKLDSKLLYYESYLRPDQKGTFRPQFPEPGHTERCQKRIRGWYNGVPLFDTQRAFYVWENAYFPTVYLPKGEFFGSDFFRRTGGKLHNQYIVIFLLGSHLADVVEDDWALIVKDREITRVTFVSEGMLEGYIRVPFKVLDWKEEDDQIIGYPRDPYKRIEVHQCIRTIQFTIDQTVFQSDQAVILFQSGFPPRFYFTPDIFKLKAKSGYKKPAKIPKKSGTKYTCPYKGEAEYFNLEVGGKEYSDLVWSYSRPNPEVLLIKDRFCFSNRQVTLLKIEGAAQRQEPVAVDYEMTPEELSLFTYEC